MAGQVICTEPAISPVFLYGEGRIPPIRLDRIFISILAIVIITDGLLKVST
jgi:hypothetical protein